MASEQRGKPGSWSLRFKPRSAIYVSNAVQIVSSQAYFVISKMGRARISQTPRGASELTVGLGRGHPTTTTHLVLQDIEGHGVLPVLLPASWEGVCCTEKGMGWLAQVQAGANSQHLCSALQVAIKVSITASTNISEYLGPTMAAFLLALQSLSSRWRKGPCGADFLRTLSCLFPTAYGLLLQVLDAYLLFSDGHQPDPCTLGSFASPSSSSSCKPIQPPTKNRAGEYEREKIWDGRHRSGSGGHKRDRVTGLGLCVMGTGDS